MQQFRDFGLKATGFFFIGGRFVSSRLVGGGSHSSSLLQIGLVQEVFTLMANSLYMRSF